MNVTLEQGIAAAVRFILDNDVEGTKPYFEEIPEAFYVPSVYFPVPYMAAEKVTLSSFVNNITFEARIMAGTDWDAQARAANLRDLIIFNNLAVPVYESDGTDSGWSIKVTEPFIRRLEQGIVLLSFTILDYFTPAESAGRLKANDIHLIWNRIEEIYS